MSSGNSGGGWDPNLTEDELFARADSADPVDSVDAAGPVEASLVPSEASLVPPEANPAALDEPPDADPADDTAAVDVNADDDVEPFVPGGYGRAGWWFLRLSGLLLVVLLLGNIVGLHLLDGGVHGFNWGVLAARWTSPLWRLWDIALIWLGLLHGGLGLRTVINDYTRRADARSVATLLLAVIIVVVAGLATLVIVTFDPGI